ncbi:hypothetical protein A249_05077 [Pseudomonas syringae pv. actinidiae ICMP 18804]|uniref:Uncharacterized protein n=1 Tax=Pseudomonas syringae pv. actinidiae ICMP 19096 TaxID=1194405 RepID=A0A656JMA9_PSESF|nr:hypothetical protein A246_03015 [Pseudomonas syringae pv. actinidiae ICMP 19098]EPN18142.1 hypothetical protein A249_05077 [Pseudomonas syringae pv. actinidiae ICMP 18804]EPN21300.1 hypothetical protein A248_03483 [Pseudomonas syringae pv. actinidiae ICMP 19100]EPN28866.1 hypothetical protein A247_03327 [Pseudomonas syringae pv. actinidiae ICMP 19099]EPN37025.1 hypothetical protein A243_03567 [Pseudomonas syringae pv. actinidiae ICMP 18883]EPN38202.1 hypothetical protein A245_38894 [Pseudom
MEVFQIPVLFADRVFYCVQKLQTRPQWRRVTDRAQVWQRELLNRRLKQEQVAERNVRDACPFLGLQKGWPCLARFPFLDPLRLYGQLSSDLCSRKPRAFSGPREDAWINKCGLAHGEFGTSEKAVSS